MSEILFNTENLSFNNMIQFGNIVIPKKEVTFISGESGMGKSTLLKLLNGTLTPSNGRVFYNGKDILELDTIALRKEISLVSQDVFLFNSSIKDNFRLFYEYRDQTPPTNDQIKKFLTLCCISFSLDKDCSTMSGGERQRIYIAIFLSFLPKVIMLDEPTSALDDKNSNVIMENIIGFCKKNNISVIVVSHDKALTERYAENNLVIRKSVN
ncbi:MAG: ABC transporter ATP-binding protein [Anaerovoracaceae bacterium]|jgi:putative ABC transport system ATP-binding protein